jgi:DNA-binding CsgD family transcriptional regulator
VNVIRINQLPGEPSPANPVLRRELYFFHEINTGISRFHVEAGPGGEFPVEEAAGLLAMYCLTLGQTPQDYVVMVQAAQGSLGGLSEKVEKLLEAGASVGRSVKLTRRQEEVLNGVIRGQANKEIASALNLSERTVKFHLSALLAKFCVPGRMELALMVTRRTLGPMGEAQSFWTSDTRTGVDAQPNHRARRVGRIALAERHLMS